jgi:predicted amidohydrolase YtcJ
MKRIFGVLLTLMLAAALFPWPAVVSATEEADIVYLNGNIYTVDEGFTVARAMAITGDRFSYVGSNEGAQAYIGSGTAVVDLYGKMVVPGLMDSHNHFGSVGTNLFSKDINCYWLPLDQLQAAIAAAVADPTKQRPGPDGWVVCRGYNDAIWDPPVAHKGLLDPISGGHPVAITRYCGHATLANTRAMELAGIDAGGVPTPDPSGGTIVRDAQGNPTGVFIDGAQSLITRVIPAWPPLTEEERRLALQLGSQAVLATGLTVVHDASGASMSEVLRREALYEAGLLKVRINNMLSRSTALALGAPQTGLYDNHYFLQSVKVIADGSLGGRGAALIEDYSDAPGYRGVLRVDPATFTAQTTELLGLGFATRTHAIGDLTNRLVLDAYETAMQATGKTGDEARLAIEHSQILSPEDLPRFGELGIVASMQPKHATEDMLFAEDRLGPDRILGGYAWRDLLDDGVVIACGSDYSVSPYNPFYGLHAAVTRQDQNNQPPGGWYPYQRMTREEALRCYTNGGAYVMFAEDILGSIEVGKLADFVVIDRDYMTVPAEDIWRIKVLTTVVGGEVVYTAPEVAIDIKPGSNPNPINLKSNGVVPVALLATDDLDLSMVDPASVAFVGAAPKKWIWQDVDGDGDLDMLFHFDTQSLGLTPTSTHATLTGLTYAGVVFQGTDTVKIVPK